MKLDKETYTTLIERGVSPSDIPQMSADDIFDEYCQWHGLINWGPRLRRVLENAKEVESCSAHS